MINLILMVAGIENLEASLSVFATLALCTRRISLTRFMMHFKHPQLALWILSTRFMVANFSKTFFQQ